jgi:hypothetical protein
VPDYTTYALGPFGSLRLPSSLQVGLSPMDAGVPSDAGQPGGDPYFDPSSAPPPPSPDPRLAAAMTPPAVDDSYQQKLHDARTSASFPDQRVNDAQYAMQRYGLSAEEALAAAQRRTGDIKDPARKKLVDEAAHDLSFPNSQAKVAQQLMDRYGLTQDDALKIAGGNSGVAHITQAAGPMGTIGQIGKPMGSQGGPTLGDVSSLSSDLADAQAMQTPVDPNKPEEAGAGESRRALQLQADAAKQQGAADSAAGDAEAKAIADRNASIAKQQAETEQRQKFWDQRLTAIQGDVQKKTDDWANYKVDPGRRWKNMSTGAQVGAGIGVLFSVLGDALQKKSGPNLALGIIDKAIQDDVDQQVADREHLGAVASRARTSLDDYYREYGNWKDARAAKLSEEYKRTANEIERIGAVQKSDLAKARMTAAKADFLTKAGALDSGIATGQWNREQKQADFAEQKRAASVRERQAAEGIALDRRRLDQQGAQFDKDLQYKYDALHADTLAKLAAGNGAAAGDSAKILRENGIRDPATRQYITGDDGQPILDRNAAEAEKTQAVLSDTQTLLSTVDGIKSKLANDPGFQKLNPTQKQAAVGADLKILALQLKNASQAGALDKGLVDFVDSMSGGDPTKITAASLAGALGIGADSTDVSSAKLDEIANGFERSALNRLGNPKSFKFQRVVPVQASAENKAAESLQRPGATVMGEVKQQEPGFIAKGLQDVESTVFGTEQNYKKDARTAEESGGSLKYPGFEASQDKNIDTLVSGVAKGNPEASKRLIEMVGQQKDPELRNATMTLIESQKELAPLLPQALAALPKEERDMRQAGYVAAKDNPNLGFSTLTPEQEATIASLPQKYRAAVRTALERGGK